MNFKTVHGLGRTDYAKRAFDVAMQNSLNPSFVEAWVEWFDKAPADEAKPFLDHKDANCIVHPDECCNRDRSGCHNCKHGGVACADDCPQPEYYLGDLEEVAHAMVTRTESALSLLVQQMARPGSVAALAPEVKALFDGIRAEISLSGYVEGLIPE